MTIGENIRKYRKQKGLTQKELGDLCGINEVQIRRYELGGKNSNPKIETIQKIALALDVNVYDLDDTVIDIRKSENWFNSLKKELNQAISKQEEIFEKLSSEELSQEEVSKYAKQLRELIIQEDFAENQIDTLKKQIKYEKELHDDTEQILTVFNHLNTNGRQKVIDYSEDLAQIPKYQKSPLPINSQQANDKQTATSHSNKEDSANHPVPDIPFE